MTQGVKYFAFRSIGNCFYENGKPKISFFIRNPVIQLLQILFKSKFKNSHLKFKA